MSQSKKSTKRAYESRNAIEFEYSIKLRGKKLMKATIELHEDFLTMRGGAYQMGHVLTSKIEVAVLKICNEHQNNG